VNAWLDPDGPAPLPWALFLPRPLMDGKPTAYVCFNEVCTQPITEPRSLASLLETGQP
jgi:uncharacterized protein YyaL (SSP411 family)